jgi:hypothetical protein
MKKWFPEVVVFCAILMVVQYAFSQSWRQCSSRPYITTAIAASADGRAIMAVGSGNPALSIDSGNTWITDIPDTSDGSTIAISANGTKMVAIFETGYVSVSTNSGLTWTQTSLPAWYGSCASSADGTKLVVALWGDSIYTSTNSGISWLTNNAANNNWISVASSSDGTKLAAAADYDQIYTSTNSGLTWSPTSAPTNIYWNSIASSFDGTHLIATGDNGTYFSTNSGSSWKQVIITGKGAGVASSANGSKLIVCSYGDGAQIYTSTNFGVDWASTNIPGKQWLCAASSADGYELLAGELNGGGVWIYQVTPSPQLKITRPANDVTLSWLVPSTNFTLQQNMDLTTTNWLTLTNVPMLNLTNLNYEITLPASSGNSFFQLVTPR